MRRFALSVLMMSALAGCSSAPDVQPSFYLLRPSSTDSFSDSTLAIIPWVERVSVAHYVGQPGLLLETDQNVLTPAVNHLWAEPLSDSVRHYLNVEISRLILDARLDPFEEASLRIRRIEIVEMHGTANGRARMVAVYTFKRDADQTQNVFAEVQDIQARGYPSLVESYKKLLLKLAQVLAKRIVEESGVLIVR